MKKKIKGGGKRKTRFPPWNPSRKGGRRARTTVYSREILPTGQWISRTAQKGKIPQQRLEDLISAEPQEVETWGRAGPASINRVVGPGGEVPTRARHSPTKSKGSRCESCPSALRSVRFSVGRMGDRPALSTAGRGTGLWFKGSHMPRSCSRPALGARILGTFMPPPVSQVRAPQTGQVGMNSQTCQRGRVQDCAPGWFPICMTFL